MLVGPEFDFIDPGMSTNATTRGALTAVHRTLYHFAPETKLTPRPDLATGPPQISDAGRRVTVRLRPTPVRTAPQPPDRRRRHQVRDRATLHSRRSDSPSLGRAYGDLAGVDDFVAGRAAQIAGIETPDDATIVFRLERPTAGSLIAAPRRPRVGSRAARVRASLRPRPAVDLRRPSGPLGPVHVRRRARRDRHETTAMTPAAVPRLVRNPAWDGLVPTSGRRISDAIEFRFGNDDAGIAMRQIIRGLTRWPRPACRCHPTSHARSPRRSAST